MGFLGFLLFSTLINGLGKKDNRRSNDMNRSSNYNYGYSDGYEDGWGDGYSSHDCDCGDYHDDYDSYDHSDCGYDDY